MKCLFASIVFICLSFTAHAETFSGDNPKPGLIIHIDSERSISFVAGIEPETMQWVIASPEAPPPGQGRAASVSCEAGTLKEKSFYQWDAKTQTFWFGRRGIVQKETLVTRNGITSSTVNGAMYAVTDKASLDEFKDAPEEFLKKMRELIISEPPK